MSGSGKESKTSKEKCRRGISQHAKVNEWPEEEKNDFGGNDYPGKSFRWDGDLPFFPNLINRSADSLIRMFRIFFVFAVIA